MNLQPPLFGEPPPTRLQRVIAVYERHESVWAAGVELGIAGQTVHKILRAAGYRLKDSRWTQQELQALHDMSKHMTISEIAHTLGRPYSGVAGKISELGIGVRYGNKQKRKIPRGAGYDKDSVKRYAREIDQGNVTVTRYARRQGLTVDSLARAFERHLPEWWNEYLTSRRGTDVTPKTCPYCRTDFIPNSGKQTYCTRRCSDLARTDNTYFGGKRRQNTIGLAEGICQLCLRSNTRLSSHHVYGKQNDPDNDYLVALCTGCHQIVSHLGGRVFLDEPEGWERLIHLVYSRRHGPERPPGLWACVEFEVLTPDEIEEMHEEANA